MPRDDYDPFLNNFIELFFDELCIGVIVIHQNSIRYYCCCCWYSNRYCAFDVMYIMSVFVGDVQKHSDNDNRVELWTRWRWCPCITGGPSADDSSEIDVVVWFEAWACVVSPFLSHSFPLKTNWCVWGAHVVRIEEGLSISILIASGEGYYALRSFRWSVGEWGVIYAYAWGM